MCASYGRGYEISHACEDDVVKTETVENAFESLPNQVIRDARHQDHCFSVCGKCMCCICICMYCSIRLCKRLVVVCVRSNFPGV